MNGRQAEEYIDNTLDIYNYTGSYSEKRYVIGTVIISVVYSLFVCLAAVLMLALNSVLVLAVI